MNRGESTTVVSVESGYLEERLISFKELLFFNIIKKGERVVKIRKVMMSSISAIKVTDCKFTISGV